MSRPGLVLALLILPVGDCDADIVTFVMGGKQKTIEGNVVMVDRQETILLEGRDTQFFVVRSEDRQHWEKSDEEVPYYTKQQLRNVLRKEYGGDFYVHSTTHYMIVYNCSAQFAKEAGELLERAYFVFTNYFNRRLGFRFEEPKHPLVAVIFKSRDDYLRHVSDTLGPMAGSTSGVYVTTANRMFLFDSFGQAGALVNAPSAKRNPAAIRDVRTKLYEQNVSNLIHEAIHQVAFNTGFHNRMSIGNPLWLVEGMAMFFETPDLASRNGWKGVGGVNVERLDHFRKLFPTLPAGCLDRMIQSDADFRNASTANDSYALAWALTYYLTRSKAKSYGQYIRTINERPLMTPYTAEERRRDFRAAFGKDPAGLELDFRRDMSRVLTESK